MQEMIATPSISGNTLFEFHFKGASFENNSIELSELASELKGLNIAIEIALRKLIRERRISVRFDELEFVVAPFQDGSFKKFIKVIEKHPTTSAIVIAAVISPLASVLTSYLVNVSKYRINSADEISPQVIGQLKDKVVVELLVDPDFRRNIASVCDPLRTEGDELDIRCPNTNQSLSLGMADKTRLNALASVTESEFDYETSEELNGRITRVDLDARVKILGFKVDGHGSTVDCSLAPNLTQEDKTVLLGKWVRIGGQVKYYNGERKQIEVQNILILEPPKQDELKF